jgi:hypothetical protein
MTNKVEKRLRVKQDDALAKLIAQHPWLESRLTVRARERYWEQLWNEGGKCPCCDRYGKIYVRKLDYSIAHALILLHKFGPNGEWVHYKRLAERLASRAFTILRFWGLVEPDAPAGETWGRGNWRVTDLGRRFVLNRVRVPQSHLLFHANSFGPHGSLVSIVECLADRFDYDELMQTPASDARPAKKRRKRV